MKFIRRSSGRIDTLNLFSFQSFFARQDFKRNSIALFEGFEARTDDRGVMHKDVLTGILRDEAEPFFVVKPLYFSTRHNFSQVARQG